MSAYVRALADDAADIWHSKRNKSYRAADAHCGGYKKHNHQQTDGFLQIAKLDLAAEMSRQLLVRGDCIGDADGKEHKCKCNIAACYALQLEVGGTPEVILLEQISCRSIGHNYSAERADECAEYDAKGNQILGRDFQCHDKAHQRAEERADKCAHSQRAEP